MRRTARRVGCRQISSDICPIIVGCGPASLTGVVIGEFDYEFGVNSQHKIPIFFLQKQTAFSLDFIIFLHSTDFEQFIKC